MERCPGICVNDGPDTSQRTVGRSSPAAGRATTTELAADTSRFLARVERLSRALEELRPALDVSRSSRVVRVMKLDTGTIQTTINEDFDSFFAETYMGVARAAALVARDRGTGQELAQEAFFRLFERWPEIDGAEHARRFVYRVAINLARSHLRKHLRVRLSGLEPRAHDTHMPDPEAWIEVADALGHLSRRRRAVIVLVDYVGLGASDAAAVLRISPSTVRTHLMLGRRELRHALSLPDEGESR